MIGTGIFTTSGFLMEALRDPQAMLLCWLIGGIVALCGALCYGELGAMYPRAGGEYVFLSESLGKLWGFLSGWISLIVGFSAPIAAASIAFASYFFRSIPESFTGQSQVSILGSNFITLSSVSLLAILVIIIFSIVHWYGLNFGSGVQNLLTVFKLIIILVFVLAGLSFGHGSMAHFSRNLDFGIIFSGEFTTSLIFVAFAYSGWNAAAYLGAEIKDPEKSIPRSLFYGTFVVTALYLLLNIVFIYALSIEEMGGVVEVGAKSALVLFGPKMGSVFSVAVTVCLLSVISAMIMTGPRIYYAMAKDRVFFSRFGMVSEKHRTPGFSILLQGGIAIVMVLTSSFDKLLLYIGFTLSLFTMLTVFGLMVLRIKRSDLIRPYKTLGYPVTPILFILMNLWIIIFSIKGNPVTTLYGAVTIITGILFYYFRRIM
jgi:APA family basic amino acid/polyamine antiporter